MAIKTYIVATKPLPKIVCPACGGTAITTKITFDHFCFGDGTVECRCNECKKRWFNDTLSTDK